MTFVKRKDKIKPAIGLPAGLKAAAARVSGALETLARGGSSRDTLGQRVTLSTLEPALQPWMLLGARASPQLLLPITVLAVHCCSLGNPSFPDQNAGDQAPSWLCTDPFEPRCLQGYWKLHIL